MEQERIAINLKIVKGEVIGALRILLRVRMIPHDGGIAGWLWGETARDRHYFHPPPSSPRFMTT